MTPQKKPTNYIQYVLMTAGMIAAATVTGWVFRYAGFPETNIVIVYLLSILLIARFTKGYAYGIASSVIATFSFNYFFTAPYYTLSVNDPTYIITFVIMTITAIITSTLTSKEKQNALDASEKEAETSAIFQLTNRLTDAADMFDIAGISVDAISVIMDCRAALLCFDENGIPEHTYIQQQSNGQQIRRKTEDMSEINHRLEGLRAAFISGEEFQDWPIYGREDILGLLRIPKDTAVQLNEMQKRLLRSMIESTALAMDRFRSVQQQLKSREETVQERYRSNLLRAISHDLRTPLSGIIGTSEILMDITLKNDQRYNLAQEIHKDADWLHSLVENILSLTRIQDGRLSITKQMEAAEEVIEGAVSHMMKRSAEYEITVHIPDEVLFVPMDAKLIAQVLINLLDNAVKHSPPGNEITICVYEDKAAKATEFTVSDRGCGIAETDMPNIFKMFYTTHSGAPDTKRGVGLGLTICEAIIKAHGGKIEGHNRSDGQGAEFIFTLPMEDQTDVREE